ncbi:MAG: amidohydrolase family protein [Erysipelotrichaceae bacterium]|jgi:adenine deaminase|nr:amidohydrolase family protein [Erysipelotrichaceae bacterium]
MKFPYQNKKKLLAVAMGQQPADLAVHNVKVFNVFTGELQEAVVYVSDNAIAHIERKDLEVSEKLAKKVYDGQGGIVIPGYIDTHIHIESTMMTPRNFAKWAVLYGTTTVISDPHELANVVGIRGVEYMHEAAEGLPMRQLINIPSCVPSVPGLEEAGASFGVEEVEKLSKLERVVGLAEVMDFIGVVNGEARMMDIIAASEKAGLFLQGHAPSVSGRMLSAYLCGGPKSDHETWPSEEAKEKMRAGLYVDARESSIARNVKAIWEGVKDFRYHDTLCFCTDDREAADVVSQGEMNNAVKVAVEAGMHPLDAIRCATFNNAREYHFENLGALAPGYIADFQILESLEDFKPKAVFFEGRLVAENGKLTAPILERSYPLEKENTMKIKDLKVSDFIIDTPVKNGTVTINAMVYQSYEDVMTRVSPITVEVKDGRIILPPDTNFVAVVNRHGHYDNIALNLVQGFGSSGGTIASTVSHDSHNLTIVYDTPENALLAANTLKDCGGGLATIANGKVLALLPLPLCGLISLLPGEEIAKQVEAIRDANFSLGMTMFDNPVMRIMTLALIVIPMVKMSDKGLIDVYNKKVIELFA